MKKSLLLVSSLIASSVSAEFANVPGVPGELISHSHPELGRLTTIEVLGKYIIAIPEIPSSPSGADFNARVLDISDPSNPVTVLNLDRSAQPILAHGTFKRGNEVYVGGFPDDAVRLEEDGSISHTTWSGPKGRTFNTSDMYYPWGARHWWSYGEVEGLAYLNLDGVPQAEWDHLGLTGVVGFPTILGNLLIYSSDQSFSGMATYDISDPENPTLLDVFNLPETHPTFTKSEFVGGVRTNVPIEYGLGGYWSAPHGHYMVYARNGDNPGVQVVDFEDPTNLKLHCEILFQDPSLDLPNDRAPDSERGTRDIQYLNFQDEFIFAERLKINIETCELDLVLDEVGTGVETSQYVRPLGNMLLTGGAANHILRGRGLQEGGLGIFYHQSEPDFKAPYVAYHIPQDGQENYPTIAPISVMIPETIQGPTVISGDTLIVQEVGGDVVEVEHLISHTGVITIDPLEELKPATQYRVTLDRIEDAVGNQLAPYSFEFTTASSSNFNHAPSVERLNVPDRRNLLPGQVFATTVNAFDEDGDVLEYRFRVSQGGQGEYSEYSSNPYFEGALDIPGRYTLTAQVRDSQGAVASSAALLTVLEPPEDVEPLIKGISSGPLALESGDENLWVVNPDNLGIANINVADMELVREPRRSQKPVSISIDQNGDRWVVYQGQDRVELVNRFGGSFHTIQFDYGSKPSAIVIDKDNHTAYVALEGSGEVAKIDTESRTEVARLSGLEDVHALALSGDREHLLATRFVSPQSHGEVFAIDPASMRLVKTIILDQSLEDDSVIDGSGVPNYLAHVAIDGRSRFAYVVGKKDNVGRGAINGNAALDDDNTVRTIIAMIDLDTLEEVKSARVDIDNSDSPSAVTFSLDEEALFVALQGNNRISVFSRDTETGRISRTVSSNFGVGLAPQGLLLNEAGDKLYVKNFTDRTVSQIDLTEFNAGNIVNPAISHVRSVREGDETLSEQELLGQQIFYNASFGLGENGEFTGRMSAEGYMSCASCHFDGGEDGRVYDFSDRGEGLRNNLSLNAHATRQGRTLFHWSGNFDEIQDFENDIRHRFLGRGLMTDADFDATETPLGAAKEGLSEDLDALAAFVQSLGRDSIERSPYRDANGGLTESAKAGYDTFIGLNCQSCHQRFRAYFSDGQTHDVGTIREYSGSRSGEQLDAIRTPFLVGLFNTAPYLHDGSAEEVEDVFVTVGGTVIQAEQAELLNNAQIVDAQGFSYYRHGSAVAASHTDGISIVEYSDAPRQAYLRVRYGSAQNQTSLVVEVNGQQYRQTLAPQVMADGQDVAFSEAKFVIDVAAGNNEIKIWPEMTGANYSLILDDVTISTPEREAAASVHTQVNGLSDLQKSQLMDYLKQIDQGNNVP